MNRKRRLRSSVALLLLVSLVAGLPGSTLHAAATGSIRVSLQPAVLLADGQSRATVVAEVRDSRGNRVPDGTPVRFTTTAGTIEAVALTVAGTARATITAAAIPDTAQISVVAEGASAAARLPMVSEMPDLKGGRTIVRVEGRYVAYDEHGRILEAVDDARLLYRGLTITARRLQVDLNSDTLRADGDVQVESRKRRGGDGARGRNGGATESSPSPPPPLSPSPPLPVPGEEKEGLLSEEGQENGDLPPPAPPPAPRPPRGESPGDGSPFPRGEGGWGGRSDNAGGGRSDDAGGIRSADAGAPSLTGDRLFMNLRQIDGVLASRDGVLAFGGTDLRERPAPKQAPGLLAPMPDLSESDMLWTAQGALVFLGSRIQLRGATPYWAGTRLLPLGYQEIPLDGSTVGTDRYVGVGSDGLVVDLPYYLSMGAGGSTSLRLRHGDRSGFGFFAQNPGWQLDLERKYGEPGGVEGLFTLDSISPDWGLRWSHSQPLGGAGRVHAYFDFPKHQDLYGQIHLNQRWRFATATLSLAGNKFRDRALGHSLNFGMESRPWALGSGFTLSLEGSVQDSRGGEYLRLNDRRIQVPGVTQQQVGLRLRPPQLRLSPSSSLTSSIAVRQAWGNREGIGLVGALNFMQRLGENSSLSLNYNYNQTPGYTYLQNSGRQNLSASLYFRPGERLRLSAFGLVGLDNPTRSLTGSASYLITPSWRLDLLHSLYQFDFFSSSDTQIGIARALGNRELFLYWSSEHRRLGIEVGINQF